MEDIIAATSLSKGGFYHYYGSTKEILSDIMCRSNYQFFEEHLELGRVTTKEELRAALTQSFLAKILQEKPEKKLFLMFAYEMLYDSDFESIYLQFEQDSLALIERIIRGVLPNVRFDTIKDKELLICRLVNALLFSQNLFTHMNFDYIKQSGTSQLKCRRWDSMRLFIAVNFDQETKRNMLVVQERLRKVGQGNFSSPENLHLTLAFLGEVTPDRAAAVKRAMEQTAVRDLILTFDHAGCFQRDGGDVWWLGLAENRALLEMRQELCGHLSAAGFKLESRRFSPHITLARNIRQTEKPDRQTLFGASFATHADTITLMLSERVGGRLVYTEQYSVRTKMKA
jgi:2'-5' RNA ligase